jgi:uncharacterized protein
MVADPNPQAARVRLGRDDRKGRCLLAVAPIGRGEVIETAPVVVFNSHDAHLIDGTPLYPYYLRWRGDIDDGGQGAVAFGLVTMCNHSGAPNAAVRPNYNDDTVDLYALEDIAPGSEITLRYHEVWFAEAHDVIEAGLQRAVEGAQN